MKKHKCECPELGEVLPEMEYMYDEAEKSGMNHKPGKCKGTNEVKLYERHGKKLWLCSCCNMLSDIPTKS